VLGGHQPGTSPRVRREYLRRAARHSDVMVYVDALSAEWLVDRALHPKLPVAFIPQGLDLGELAALRGGHRHDRFVYAHNLWRWKRPDVFIFDVAARLPELGFTIIANDRTGNVIEETLEMAEQVPNVEVKLGLPREEFLRTIAGAPALVSTSSTEGAQPNIMLEAGALGVPYLSLCPGQNFGHYPHVEMFATIEELVGRLRAGGPGIRDESARRMHDAVAFFSEERYGWPAVIEQFRQILV
jgi:glycosyltransferase involved in cell wall biosynthesis